MSVKNRIVLTSMASLELCTDSILGFMGPDKLSSFCNYYIKPHLPASCGVFTFGGRMRPRAKTSSLEQGPDFDLVGTCKWLSYVRASGSQAYDVLVRFFPCKVYIDSSHRNTLSYELQLVIAVISQYVWCTVGGFDELDMDMFMMIVSLCLLYLLTLTLTWVNILLVYACSSL
jgi:hypothetical protein